MKQPQQRPFSNAGRFPASAPIKTATALTNRLQPKETPCGVIDGCDKFFPLRPEAQWRLLAFYFFSISSAQNHSKKNTLIFSIKN